MRTLVSGLLVLLVAPSIAAGPPSPRALNPSTAHLYVNPLRVIVLGDGSHFVIHQPRNRATEPHAIEAMTVDAATGDPIRAFFVSKWLGEEMLEETSGQIYGATLMPSGGKSRFLLISAGYQDPDRRVKHAILKLKRSADGAWLLRTCLPVEHSVGDIAATSDGGFLAVAFDPKNGLGLTRFDGEGRAIGQWFQDASLGDAGPLAVIRARIQPLGGDRFAYHDGLSDRLELFTAETQSGETARRETLSIDALRDDGGTRRLRAWHVQADGSITIVRAVRDDKGLRAVAFDFSADGKPRNQVTIHPPPASEFWEGDELRVVSPNRDGIQLRPVALRAVP